MKHLTQIIADALPLDSEEFWYRFDCEVASITESINYAADFTEQRISLAKEAICQLNKCINTTAVGSKKIDESGQGCELLKVSSEVFGRIADVADDVKRRIEASGLSRMSLGQAVDAVDRFRKSLLDLYQAISELVERVEIHDAMTEQPIKKTGIAELDALNDL